MLVQKFSFLSITQSCLDRREEIYVVVLYIRHCYEILIFYLNTYLLKSLGLPFIQENFL